MGSPDDDEPAWTKELDAPAAAPAAAEASDSEKAPAWAALLPDPTEGTSAAPTGPPHASPRVAAPDQVAPVNVTASRFHQAGTPEPNEPEMSWGDTLKGAVHNFLPSAGDTAKSIGHGIAHPLDTLQNLGSLGGGLLSQAMGAVGVHQDRKQKLKDEALAKAVEQHYAAAYGSVKGFKKALATDPVGIGMDASTVIPGVGMAAKAAGLEKAALIASKAASAIDPIANAGRAAKAAASIPAAAARHVSAAMTGVPADLIRKAAQAGATADPALRGAFLRFYGGQGDPGEVLQAAQSALAKVRQKASSAYVAKKAALSTAAPSFQPIDDALAAARAKTQLGGVNVGQFAQPNEAIDKAESIINGWKQQAAGPFVDPRFHSVQGFDNLKQAIGDLRSEYGDQVFNEHLGGIYNGAKKAITDVDPEYARLMESYQSARANLTDLQKTLLGAGKNPAASSALSKMLKSFKTAPGKNLLGQLSAEEPSLSYMLAGDALHPWAAKGLTGQLERWTALPAAMYTGHATGEPILGALQLGASVLGQSPKVVGGLNYAGGLTLGKLAEALPTVGRVGYYSGQLNGEQGATEGRVGQEHIAEGGHSPADVDAATRMVMAEAGGEGAEGQAAALHAALNRAKASGMPLSDVINQPHAFEGVANGKAGSFDPSDPTYRRIRDEVIVPILQGKIPDPTRGATHFLNPELQRELGRPIPAWAKGKGVRIGSHVFFPGDETEAAHADGGRVERASGGRVGDDRIDELVERLVRKLKAAKAAHKGATQPLLKLPDETVAKALQIANSAL